MLEREIETYLVKRCGELGILCYKFTSPQRRNVPDRILVYNGEVTFMELKAPGKKPTAGQLREHERLASQRFYVAVADSFESVESYLKFICLLQHE